ncbi:hypothetical protein MBRA1_000414 [Malassezia brasiliensis]|uniref:Eisosome component PIL1-domain-containing protein n=1 Tax=Malassezia brasiliensis TaxID=1821822 RepID=A0AAF0DS66_9BASI|nr:hypothetical protein MBRA1_000414 [Malassezia brasiliensis]
MSIFKKAQTAVAHNSTFSTFGNSELKDLQNLIHAEKLFTNANAKAAAEVQKSADSLRTWSHGEGDDLEDVLPKVALLYEHFSKAELRFNYFVSTMRLHLKSIRSREEAYAELKSRKRTLASKIESVERKLAKMGPENKELARVTSSLREMRSDMEVLRHEMEHEEAALGDFKRRTIVEALNLKSGGMMELGEKCIVIAETCRLLGEELPMVATVPGKGRQPYRNEARTDRLLQEAIRQLDSIHFQPRQEPQNESLSRDYSSPTATKFNESASGGGAAVGGAGARTAPTLRTSALAADQSLSADDTSRGSQGWSAPGHGPSMPASAPMSAPDAAAGLPTVPESEDVQDYSEAYVEEGDPRAYADEGDPQVYNYADTAHYPGHMGHEADLAASATMSEGMGPDAAYGSMIPEADEAAYANTEAPGEYGVQVSNMAYPGYDMGLGYPNDAIPALPPMPPASHLASVGGGQYISLTPNSRGSPLGDASENRAYFEGVGSTKALQAAAARINNFPAIDHLDINQTPGMFATDEASGRSLSPSALRPFGHMGSQASSPRFNDTSFKNIANVSRPLSPESAHAQRMAPSAATSRTPSMASPVTQHAPYMTTATSPLTHHFAEPTHAPATTAPAAPAAAAPATAPPTTAAPAEAAPTTTYSQAPPPITAPNPARYAKAASPISTTQPTFTTGAQSTSQPETAAAPPVAAQVTEHTAPAPAAPAVQEPAVRAPVTTNVGAAPAVQVGAYLPYVAD